MSEIPSDQSGQNELQIFLNRIEERLHKGIDMTQAAFLSSEMLKDNAQSHKYEDDELKELIEIVVSQTLGTSVLLRDLQRYIRTLGPELTKVDVPKIGSELTKT